MGRRARAGDIFLEQLLRTFPLVIAIICVGMFLFSFLGQIIFKRKSESDPNRSRIWLLGWANIWAACTYIMLVGKLRGELWNAQV